MFDRVKAAYKQCIYNFTKLGNALEQARSKEGKGFGTRVLINQFDLVLQYSLLQLAKRTAKRKAMRLIINA